MAAPAKGKKVAAVVKLQLPAGGANPAPPVGTSLGPKGVPLMEFCNQFNAATKDKPGLVIPVVVSVYADRSFSFELKTPPVPSLIKKELGITSGSPEPNKRKVGKLSQDQVRAIAEIKMPDLNAYDVEAAMRIVSGTARNMGVEVDA